MRKSEKTGDKISPILPRDVPRATNKQKPKANHNQIPSRLGFGVVFGTKNEAKIIPG